MPPDEKPAPGEGGAPAPAEEIKNLKAEMNRKMEGFNSELKRSNEALLATIQSMVVPPKRAQQDDDITDSFYKDPGQALKKVKEDAKKEALQEFNTLSAEQLKRNNVIAKLVQEYPELADDSHDFTQAALKKFDELAKENGNTPVVYRTAVLEAAMEKGIKPKNKRDQGSEGDDFTMSGGGQGNTRRQQRKSDELDPRTVEAAKLLGVDPEKVKQRVQKRKTYGKWE